MHELCKSRTVTFHHGGDAVAHIPHL